jgi:U3 small nucleolar RNA-associated protein 21
MVAPILTAPQDAASPNPRKRARKDPSIASTIPPSADYRHPRLFAPFRALGLITNHVPFVVQTRSHKGSTEGPRIHLLTCLGRAWAMWEGGKMGLLFVGVIGMIQIIIMDLKQQIFRSGCSRSNL